MQTQALWDLVRASLVGSCVELNDELLRNAGHFGLGLFCPGLFHPNLGAGSFRPLKMGRFCQFSEGVQPFVVLAKAVSWSQVSDP